jgi:hypothetical protein
LSPAHGLQAQQSLELKAKYHEFDFLLGHWEVYKNGTDTLIAYSHIQSIIDSVGILLSQPFFDAFFTEIFWSGKE